jgi:hypothetical protein
MKNRKTVVVAFLLVAVMLLGVGYAALTDTLTIIGNAHIDVDTANKTFDERIYFSAAEATSSSGTGTKADVVSFADDDATFTANKLALVDEKSVFTFTIKNVSNVDAEISVNPTKLSGDGNPTNSNGAIFDVEYSYPQGTTVKSNGTITVVVTVTVKQPVTAATSGTFGIELTASSK